MSRERLWNEEPLIMANVDSITLGQGVRKEFGTSYQKIPYIDCVQKSVDNQLQLLNREVIFKKMGEK